MQKTPAALVCGSFAGCSTGLEEDFKKGHRRGYVEGIEVIEFDLAYSNSDSFFKRTWIFLRYVFHSLNIVFSEKYDLVFATSTPLTAGIPGILAKIFKKKPFIFEVHFFSSWLKTRKGRTKLMNRPFQYSNFDNQK